MKKWLIFLLALCLMIFAGCSKYKDGYLEWGIIMTAENVTPTGCTLVLNKSGGNEAGMICTGYDYFITRQSRFGWKELSTQHDVSSPGTMLWNERESTAEWELSWEWKYGSLEPGNYRICKVFEDHDEGKLIKEQIIWAEFTIE